MAVQHDHDNENDGLSDRRHWSRALDFPQSSAAKGANWDQHNRG